MCKDIFLSLKNHFMAWIGKPVGSTKPISCFKVRTSYFGSLQLSKHELAQKLM